MARHRGVDSPEEALRRAFKMLNYRPRSEAEVRARLGQLGFSPQHFEPALEKLRSLNLLNDETFARGWARRGAEGRGYGPLRIERELKRKGVARPIISAVVRETFGETGGKAKASALVEKRLRGQDCDDPRIVRRIIAFLQRRGYSSSVIAEVVKAPFYE